jgi:hypothetical protein
MSLGEIIEEGIKLKQKLCAESNSQEIERRKRNI